MNIEVADDNGKGNKNVTQLYVTILDANDNQPQFLQNRYDAVLSPDKSGFAQPLVVKAADADEPYSANSNVTYEIIGGNYQDKFEIDPVTGEISMKNALALLERRSGRLLAPPKKDDFMPMINLTVRAHDQGIPYQSSIVQVYIHNQDYLNRTVEFIIKDAPNSVLRRKEEIEGFVHGLWLIVHS